MRVWIATLLLLLFSTQALPVSALSDSYAKARMSIADTACDCEDEDPSVPKGGKAKKQNTLSEEDYDHTYNHHSKVYFSNQPQTSPLHLHDLLYGLYSGEVTTPPPNYC